MRRRVAIVLLSVLASLAAKARSEPPTQTPDESASSETATGSDDWTKTWGEFDAGKGFEVARTPYGSLSLSGYMLVRYLNQLPASQSFTDHLGNKRVIDTRNDIQLHRMMIWLKGWIYSPKLRYQLTAWGVNSINETAMVGFMNYEFNKAFTLGGGIEGLPGIRSLNGQHPYFLGNDRQMAEDFFRPGFNSGVWVRGEPVTGLNYRVMVSNNLSQVGISAGQMTRDLAYGASVWWMPTTGEFGPRGGFGDYEMHEKLATRFGLSSVYSREDRFTEPGTLAAENAQIRLSDGVNIFETGSLAPGVTVQKADYRILSGDGAMKYRGFFLQAEYYLRWLNRLQADGPVPQDEIFDHGASTHLAYQIFPKKFELYGSASYIFGEFNRAWEIATGGNFYPFDTRNFRLNGVIAYVEKSPASSLFGYYVGGQTGPTIAVSSDLFF